MRAADHQHEVETADPIPPLWPFWLLASVALVAAIAGGVMASGGMR